MTKLKIAATLAAALSLAVAGPAFAAESARTDAHGDPLPPGTLMRLGTVRWRACARYLAFLPDGKTLVTGEMNGDNMIRFWDAATGKETATYRPASAVTAFGLSPDGKSLALNLAWESKGVVFVSVPDGKELRRFDDNSTYFHRLLFAPDGKSLAALDNDSVVRVWDMANGKEILREQEEGDGRNARLAFSPDGKKLAVGRGSPNTLRLLDVATGKELFKWKPDQKVDAWGAQVGFSPDGKKLLWTGEDSRSFALRDASTGEPVLTFRVQEGSVRPVAFSPDGKYIASADSSGDAPPTLGLWDAATGKELRTLATPSGDWMDESAFSPDGTRLAASSDYDGLLHVWDVATGKDLARTGEHRSIVCSAAFSPDGRTALTGCADKVVRLWDADKGTVVRRIDVAGIGGNTLDYDIVFSDDRKAAAVTNLQHNAQIWDLDSGKKRADLDGGEDKAWYAVFAPDGKLLASRGAAQGISLWDAATGKLARRIGGDSNYFGEFAFSPDGKTLIALHPHPSEPAEMSLWDVATGKELGKWPTQITWGAFGVQYSPDGRRIAAIGQFGHEVDLWDPAGPKEAASLVVPKDAPAPGYLQCLAFSPDGRTLAAGGSKGPIYLWEVSTGKVRAVLVGHRDRVRSVDFSPDGARLISGSHDTTALIWDLTGLADEKGAKTLTSERLAAAWDDLADADAAKAYRAGWRMACDPEASVAFLRKHLRPAEVDADAIAKALAALDSNDFDEREAASRRLAAFGDLAGPALRTALAAKPSDEARRRMEELLHRLDGPVAVPDQARALRCVEVLERVGSAEARRLLDDLAKGAPGAALTRDAKAALARLAKTPSDR